MRIFKLLPLICIASLLASTASYAVTVPPSVKPQWLIDNLRQTDLVIIEFSDEVRFMIDGHIPGSVGTSKGAGINDCCHWKIRICTSLMQNQQYGTTNGTRNFKSLRQIPAF